MNTLEYMQLKKNAILRFKMFYARFDKRLEKAKEERFSFAVNETDCLLRLKYYGRLYKQYYKLNQIMF